MSSFNVFNIDKDLLSCNEKIFPLIQSKSLFNSFKKSELEGFTCLHDFLPHNVALPNALEFVIYNIYLKPEVIENASYIISSLVELYKHPILKPLLDINAFRSFEQINAFSSITPSYYFKNGYYSLDFGRGYIKIMSSKAEMMSTLIHEMSHAMMDFLYNNNCLPFEKNNFQLESAYEKAVKETLLNISNIITSAKNSQFKFDPNLNSTELGKQVSKEVIKYTGGYNTILKNGLSTINDSESYIEKISNVYNFYRPSVAYQEFIVRYYQFVAESAPMEYMNIFLPIADYINNNVNPIIENMIESSPYTKMLNIERSENGYFVSAQPVYGEKTASDVLLHGLANNNLTEVILVIQNGVNPNELLYQKYHPLYVAILHGNTEAMRFLLDNKADINVIDKNTNENLLHKASCFNNSKVVEILLDYIPINSLGSFGTTPLDLALLSENCETIRFLHSKGATISKDSYTMQIFFDLKMSSEESLSDYIDRVCGKENTVEVNGDLSTSLEIY